MEARRNAVHGTAVAVAIDADGPLAGVLLIGPSGGGKSALALAAVEGCPWRRTALVADDVVLLALEKGEVHARAPQPIAGLVELRGFGPVRLRVVSVCRLVAAFELANDAPRLPESASRKFCAGVTLPLWPFRTGSHGPERLRLTLRSILGGQTPIPAHHSAPLQE